MRKFYAAFILLWGMLTNLCAQAQDAKQVYELVKKNAKQLQISSSDADQLTISNMHTDNRSGVLFTYLVQKFKDIRVQASVISASFKDGGLVYHSGRFIDSISAKTGSSNPSISAQQAIERTAVHLKLAPPAGLKEVDNRFATTKKIYFSPAGIARQNIETELVWLAVDQGRRVRLTWQVSIDVQNSDDWWNVFIDAATGEYLYKYNFTVHEKNPDHHIAAEPSAVTNRDANKYIGFPGIAATAEKTNDLPPNVTAASYRVIPFPKESPIHGAPTTVNSPWQLAGAGNNATTHGWHFDGANNYNITRGNNVFAYLDITPVNAPNPSTNWPDTSTTAAPTLTFVNDPVFVTQANTRGNKKFAVDNLFYWNNIIHDVFYQYGFTEASGNFQADNLNRGGVGNDWVNAQAQDGAGTDNANFLTPNDGSNGRMRMYLFNALPIVYASAPASVVGLYTATESVFSTANKLKAVGPVTGQVIYYNDNPAGTTHDACSGAPANNIAGKIAMINRGNCDFVLKVKAAQTAGAIGVIMVNNVPDALINMAGEDNTITIPAVLISQANGATLAAQLANGLTVTLADGSKDGDLDNGIVSHEYGHGISTRITGGPANGGCLSNAEQGGEGWSDYFALMMTTDWSTATVNDGGLSRPVGTYAVSQTTTGSGIRLYPYSTNMSVNQWTYGMLATNTSAPPNYPNGGEPHYVGELWAATLWDMTWNIIQQENAIEPNLYNAGGNGGNVIALNLVVNGLKMQPCQPGFLDARNAIIAADSILYNGAHKCAIWNAFARRGMGVNAVQGLSTSVLDQTPNFEIPAGLKLAKLDPVVATSGSSFTITTTATCNCQPQSGVVIRDTIPAGFTVVNSTPAGTLAGNVYTFSAANFTASENKTFAITLQATATGCTVDTVINDNRDANTTGGFVSAATGTGGGWVSSSVRANSGANSWYSAAPATVSTSTLTSASNASTTGQNLSVLSFVHYYNTEKGFDGGVVEYSIDGGTSWIDAGPWFIKNGYTVDMDASTVLAGRKGFSGTNLRFNKSVVNFSALGNLPFTIRFRNTSDNGAGIDGWFIDDITKTNGCGGLVKTGAYSSSGTVLDSVVIPVFVKASPSTITITTQPANVTVCAGANASFAVAATSSTTLNYQWQISTNGGGSFSNISGQTSSTLNLTAVTTAMSGNQYRCVITDATSTLNSTAATLTVNVVPTITTQPSATTVCVGNNASFTVAATGGTITYKWQVSTDGGTNFTDVPGGTSATLTFAATLAQNNNQYRCIIANGCTVTSNAATLTVVNAGITTQPANTAVCAGTTANFSVATTGTVTYQWQVSTDGGTNYTNISGQTSAALALTGVTTTQNNNRYRVIVTTGCGTITSTAAILTVNVLPAVTTQPASATVCVNNNASFTVAATGGTVTYQWQLSTDGGTNFGNISGQTSATLSLTSVATAQNNNQYRCVVTNGCGNATSNTATLTVVNAAITGQPANISRCIGASASFTVTTTGTVTYQWQVSTNGGGTFSNITGETGATLSLTNLAASQNNNQYKVVVTTGCGPLTSSAATLTVVNNPVTITPLPTRVCLTDAALQLAATPAGGVWTGTGINGTTFSAATAGLGDHVLTYTYTGAGGCINTGTVTAKVQDCVDRDLSLANGGVILYPVPNNGQFTIRVLSERYSQLGINVYNSTGQLVKAQTFTSIQYNNELKVVMAGAASGIYYVKITGNGGTGDDEKLIPILVNH